MLERTANLEVLGEVVLPVDAEHTLALHAIIRIRLQRHIDTRTSIDNALVQDGDFASRVIDTIVGAFRQFDTTSRDLDGPLRHIIGTQRDDIG